MGRRARRRWRRSLAALGILGVVLWAAGFATFLTTIPRATDDGVRMTDAIVVLTGGRDRIERGLTLLVEGKAQKLFVSGVYRGVDLHELLRVSPNQPAWIDCCVELGHEALDTVGNAAETAAWLRGHGFRSVRLVTAAYHMPRSVLELRRAMPEAEILPHPVYPEGSAPHYFVEYHKYLGALVRPLVLA
jgi:uncharacterized SAM-binding protein YcdF (DUF218 family)